jgi:RNA polymerase sigma-70 factor (ECF subfamily)
LHQLDEDGEVSASSAIEVDLSSNRRDTLPTVERIFTEHAPHIYRLVRLLLGSEADAEDVTQQVFLQVLRSLPDFRGESTLSTWLNRIAVNAALTFRRQRGRRQKRLSAEPLNEFAADGSHAAPIPRVMGLLPEALAHEMHEMIEKAITRLPDLYRDVFVLADIEEHSNQEVADMLRLSIAAVKSRLHRARLLMRKALAPYFEETAA